MVPTLRPLFCPDEKGEVTAVTLRINSNPTEVTCKSLPRLVPNILSETNAQNVVGLYHSKLLYS